MKAVVDMVKKRLGISNLAELNKAEIIDACTRLEIAKPRPTREGQRRYQDNLGHLVVRSILKRFREEP